MKREAGEMTKADRPRAGVRPALCVTVRAEATPGLDHEFERMLCELADQVRARENGCVSYAATRAMGSRTHFAVHARFTGWIALHRHAQTPHMKQALPLLTALMTSPVSLEIFMEV